MSQILRDIELAGDGGKTVNTLLYDGSGKKLVSTGTTVPADGGAGYAKGATFIDTNATGAGTYFNAGTTTSCKFRPVGTLIDTVTGTAYSLTVTSGSLELVEV